MRNSGSSHVRPTAMFLACRTSRPLPLQARIVAHSGSSLLGQYTSDAGTPTSLNSWNVKYSAGSFLRNDGFTITMSPSL